MKSNALISSLVFFSFALALAPAASAANYSIEIQVSSGPNQNGSPSWTAFAGNAQSAILSGVTVAGPDPATDPTGYEAFFNGQTIDAGNMIVTSFNSWLGQASPTGAFANELGNRLKFGVSVKTTGGAKFNLADIDWSNVTLDSGGGNIHSTSGTLQFDASTTYDGLQFYGVDWGIDGIEGTPDDVIVNSGEAGSTLVNALVYFGLGRAFEPSGTGTEQEQIDGLAAALAGSVTTGTYTIAGETASSSIVIAGIVPEPSSIALLGLGGLSLLFRRRR